MSRLQPSRTTSGSDRRLIAISALAAVLVTILDLRTPLGVGVTALYVLVVLPGLWIDWRPFPLAAAAATTLLTGINPLFLPAGGSVALGVFNRSIAIVVIWVTALLVARYRQASDARSRDAERLQRSAKELADIKYALDQSSIVAATDVRGRITYVNDKFCEISKYRPEELIGQDHRIINSGHHSKAFFRDLWQTIASGRIWRGEIRNRAKDGSLYWVDTTIVPLLDDRGRPFQYMAIRNDITERKRAEAQLLEQAALTRLGEMAAVVAHEVKNPLAGIRGVLQVIGGRMPAGTRDRDIIGDVIARVDVLNSLVQDLLLFARPRTPKTTPLPLRQVLEDTVALLRRDPALADVEVVLPRNGLTVMGDAGMLHTVFLNLLLNAAQAMAGRGCITLTAGSDGDTGWIAIADAGPGIPKEVLERIFEPFFTTKSRGTGLGLATARRILAMHQGDIAVACPPGGGTLVTVTLPLAKPVAGTRAADAPDTAAAP